MVGWESMVPNILMPTAQTFSVPILDMRGAASSGYHTTALSRGYSLLTDTCKTAPTANSFPSNLQTPLERILRTREVRKGEVLSAAGLQITLMLGHQSQFSDSGQIEV